MFTRFSPKNLIAFFAVGMIEDCRKNGGVKNGIADYWVACLYVINISKNLLRK
jgi:hypothetical protein